MSIYNAVENTFFQGVSGYTIGYLLDTFFPTTGLEGVDDTNFIKVIVEVLFQLGLDAFLAYAYYDFAKRNLRVDDPSHGLIFDITNFASQPWLITKIINLNSYFKKKWVGPKTNSTAREVRRKEEVSVQPVTDQATIQPYY